MSERDRALFAERLRFNGMPKKAAMIEKANGYLLDEVSALEAIAAARAEGDQAGYERGQREAIEECAKVVDRYAGCNAIAARIRRLAEPTTQQDENRGPE